ncbi:gluconate 2-dehydrogenase subunit 3 family protein [Olivibacter domesticus]|uniref:Gluconate 2-dehydrogenase subunit 3 n=1 Tax=Olivibacter domesticus TaxID=407022 RepID=A0A1H7PSF7_OLID1|nr:gluconate 2-dehydrogenase subunit 3 family protein [Olivibacter domesticus]SEL38692.1 Gluconate 2-dehydrogenase subunit 3 [Olivibacter domesticus]
MKRRSAIKNLLIIAGGIAILPSCSQESGKASIQLNNLDINQNQEDLLAEITETIIPKTDSPGAKALNLHLFVLKMVDDCHDKDDQKSFINGLSELDKLSKKQFSKSFNEASQAQRTQLLQLLESDKETNDDMYRFYAITKRRTIQGFLNSKYVMKDLKRYELIPGRYDGYASANEITKSAS